MPGTFFYLGVSFFSEAGGRRGQSVEGRRVLRELDLRARRGGEDPILTEEGGRPYFAGRPADFSISHSRGAAAVSYLGPLSPGQPGWTGCDIQRWQGKGGWLRVGERFFHPPERDFLAAAGTGEAGLRSFYLLWVLKEAYLKLRGLSILDIARAPAFLPAPASPGNPFAGERSRKPGEALEGEYVFPQGPGDGPDLVFFAYEIDDAPGGPYSLAVCRDGAGPPGEPEILRFSREMPPLTPAAIIRAAGGPAK